jgi:hypothetical protein
MMADWKRNLRRASFRGVPFYTESHGGDHGRRWADHEYPGRDTPYAEDLGRRQRVWRFTGYLIGDDYPGDRDQLVRMCEMAGGGELVHPTIGTVQAVCRSVSHSETRDRGRTVTLNFEFAEAGALQEPGALLDLISQIAGAALPLGTTATSSFLSGFDTTGGGPWLIDAAQGQIIDLATQLQSARLPAPGVDQGPLDRSLHHLRDYSEALAADPPRLARETDTAFANFTNAGEAGPVVSAMLRFAVPETSLAWQSLSGWKPLSVVGGGATYRLPVIERRALNSLSFETFTRYLALRELGYAVSGVALNNHDQAIELLDEITFAFVELQDAAAESGNDDVFRALASLLSAISHMIRARASNLNPLVSYRVVEATPANSLTLAWRMYQDSGRDLEVVQRTAARNPAFLPFTGRVLAA